MWIWGFVDLGRREEARKRESGKAKKWRSVKAVIRRIVYRLDKSFSKVQSFKEADNNTEYWSSKSSEERIQAAWYLTCRAYGLDPDKKHHLQKNLFSTRKFSDC